MCIEERLWWWPETLQRADDEDPDHGVEHGGEQQREGDGGEPGEGDAAQQPEVDGCEAAAGVATVHPAPRHARTHHTQHLAVRRGGRDTWQYIVLLVKVLLKT